MCVVVCVLRFWIIGVSVGLFGWFGSLCVVVRTGLACVWVRVVCASVCLWNVLSVCVMRLVCRPGVSMKILNGRPGVSMKILNNCSAGWAVWLGWLHVCECADGCCMRVASGCVCKCVCLERA